MVAQIPAALQAVTDLPVKEVKPRAIHADELDLDLAVRAGDQLFVFELKGNGNVQTVARAISHLVRVRGVVPDATPVVVVPYMGEMGQRLCREADVSWMDLSGNAYLVAPRLRVIVRGMPNRYVRRGRPKSVFAPKSARVSRLLLLHHEDAFTQREIAKRTKLGEGFVSRVVRALEADELVVRDSDGAVKPRDPGLLLDAWRDAYDFEKHRIHRAHVIARSGEATTRDIANALRNARIAHAATGLSAAWLFAPFAAFRTATFYVDRFESKALEGIGIRTVESGENAWFVEPNDPSVYDGAVERNGVRCVSPIQTYLDLKGHAERAKEAAQELRTRLFKVKR